MKFIHIADVHLGMKPDKGKPWSEMREQEIYETFYGIVEICEKEKVDVLLIAGDLFQGQPLVRELKEINYAFSKLSKTKVVLIAGNHDYVGRRSHYSDFMWNQNVKMLSFMRMDEVYFSNINTKIYGFSYEKRDITEARYDDLQPESRDCINILLAHGGDNKNVPFDKNKLNASGFDYVALGHIHKPGKIGEKVVYAGSPEPLDVNEVGNHGYVIGEIDENHRLQYTFVPFSKRKYEHIIIEVNPSMTFKEIEDEVKFQIDSAGNFNIFKLILTGIRDADMQYNLDILQLHGQVVTVEDQMIPDYDFATLYHENKDNMIGMFIDGIRKSNEKDEIADQALYYGIEALLKARLK